MLYAHLKLPFDIDQSQAWFDTDLSRLGHAKKSVSQVDPRIISLLADLNIVVSHAEAFYTPPKAMLPIHFDSDTECDLVKMNFAFGAATSSMNWWARRDPAYEPPVLQTKIGTNYRYFEHSACRMIGSVRIRRPTLVNAGRPHSVLNPTNEGRWVLSLVLDDAIELRHLSIMEAADRLKEFS